MLIELLDFIKKHESELFSLAALARLFDYDLPITDCSVSVKLDEKYMAVSSENYSLRNMSMLESYCVINMEKLRRLYADPNGLNISNVKIAGFPKLLPSIHTAKHVFYSRYVCQGKIDFFEQILSKKNSFHLLQSFFSSTSFSWTISNEGEWSTISQNEDKSLRAVAIIRDDGSLTVHSDDYRFCRLNWMRIVKLIEGYIVYASGVN